MAVVPGGLYRHYKGKLYRAHGIVRHSETLEEMVHYDCLYENDLGRVWVRPLSNWNEPVLVDGQPRERFSLVEQTS